MHDLIVQADDTPQLIATHTFHTLDEVKEALAAADTLWLGVRLHTAYRPSKDGEDFVWVVELYTDSPRIGEEADRSDVLG
jgi:hypothetical protein